MNRRRIAVVLLALVSAGSLSACISTPSAKRIALDVVDTLAVSESVKACMRDKINEYDQDELQEIAERANSGDTAGVEAMARFESDLRDCR